MIQQTISSTNFIFAQHQKLYRGKVRDVYSLPNKNLVIITTDRLSAFNIIMPFEIPYKGQVLNQINAKMMLYTQDLVPNWIESVPDPNVSIGKKCIPFKVEMIIRGYLSGHAAREYIDGKHIICGIRIPNSMKENDRFLEPIITPSTKANYGEYDQDISRDDILAKGIVSEKDYEILEKYTIALFKRGSEIAAKKGLILADAKYEFGKTEDGTILLIDEIHTPDSSRYFYKDEYEKRQSQGKKQKQLSKEFVRQWLFENGFQGKKGQKIPKISDTKIQDISRLYMEIYKQIVGEAFIKANILDISKRIESNVKYFLVNK